MTPGKFKFHVVTPGKIKFRVLVLYVATRWNRGPYLTESISRRFFGGLAVVHEGSFSMRHRSFASRDLGAPMLDLSGSVKRFPG